MAAEENKRKIWRLSQVARKLNVGTQSIVDFLAENGHVIENHINSKITADQYGSLSRKFAISALDKEEASLIEVDTSVPESVSVSIKEKPREPQKTDQEILIKNLSQQDISAKTEQKASEQAAPKTLRSHETILRKPKVIGTIDIAPKAPAPVPVSAPPPKETLEKTVAPAASSADSTAKKDVKVDEVLRAQSTTLKKLTIVDKIELKEPVKRRPRKRIIPTPPPNTAKPTDRKTKSRDSSSDKKINENIKATLAKLNQNRPSVVSRAKSRKDRYDNSDAKKADVSPKETQILHTTEFISVSDLASLMNVNINDLISSCMEMGMIVSTNQRLDSEEITVLADEFGFEVNFTTPEEEHLIIDDTEELPDDETRAPIVTIMGHVNHGKTSLLDFIRKTQVTAGEAGGITQHIGAYEVLTDENRKIVFLDTPGHAAFTAMRSRGTRLTDVAVIVVAADDGVMPQTEEAINHVKAASVPFIVALNKMDSQGADPEKIRKQLSELNILVEEWGGKVQSQEISAKTGQNVDQLLEKVLLEADLLTLKANAKKSATGSVIEASLDKGRGYTTNLLVQNGTLQVGQFVLAGLHVGRIKAIFNHLGQRIKQALPATPVQILGLDGAPQAGDKFFVVKNERDARELAGKRKQISRQQSIRTKKHITLGEVGRRLALGSFKELNVIIKGDVDGSIEALSDSLLKLSTEEVQLNVIHKAVGQISESDILLATSSDAIVIGFQVRPSEQAKALANREQIEIRLYSVIFDTIDEIKDAIQGLHQPKIEERITATLGVLQIFKLPKVVVAGCVVKEGLLSRKDDIRIIRDGIVIYQGALSQLKRFKEDVNEVKKGYECGLSIKEYKNVEVGDVLEGFTKQVVAS